METEFPFAEQLRPDPLFEGWNELDLSARKDMHIQSTPTCRTKRDYGLEVAYYGKKYETDEDGFTVVHHG